MCSLLGLSRVLLGGHISFGHGGPDQPTLSGIDHAVKLGHDQAALIIYANLVFDLQITAAVGDVHPHLKGRRFTLGHTQLGYEGSFESPSFPCLGNGCAYAAGCQPHGLPHGSPFLSGEFSADIEHVHGGLQGVLINMELFEGLDGHIFFHDILKDAPPAPMFSHVTSNPVSSLYLFSLL